MTDGSQPGKRRDAALRTPAARGAEAGAAMKRLRNIRGLQPLRGPPKWVPILGDLQKTLQKGEYLPLRPLPMFESNFVQVTNQGGPVYLHHRPNRVTVGVAASGPGLVLPDILLLAQPRAGKGASCLHLTRMIPLDLAHLYVHDPSTWRLKLRLATGRCYYLELDAPDGEMGFLFERWLCLINLLGQPATAWAPGALHTLLLGLDPSAPPASTWCLQGSSSHTRCSGEQAWACIWPPPGVNTAGHSDPPALPPPQSPPGVFRQPLPSQPQQASSWSPELPVSPSLAAASAKAPSSYRVAMSRKPRKAQVSGPRAGPRAAPPHLAAPPTAPQALKRRFKSQAVGDSVPLVWSQLGLRKEQSKEEKPLPGPTCERSQSEILVSEKPRLVIRTIFSIVSSPICQRRSVLKGGTAEVGTLTVQGRLAGTPSFYISGDSPDASSVDSYNYTEEYLGQEDVEDLVDPMSSTLSSSVCPGVPLTAFYHPTTYASTSRPTGNARTPLPQKALHVPLVSWKAPFILDQSQRIPPAPAPSQRVPPVPASSQKIPPVPAPSQKIPPVPAPSQRVPPVPASSQKIPPAPAPSQRAPPAPAPSQKIPPVPAPSQRAPPAPAPSQKIPPVLASSQRAPPVLASSQRAPPVPALSHRVPPVLAPSQKIASVPAPSQRVPPVPAPSQRAPPVLASSQRAPPVPASSQRVPPVLASSQRAPPVLASSQRAPPVPALSHRVPPVLAPSQKIASVPASSQRAPPAPAPSQRVPPVLASSQRAPPVPALSQKIASVPALSQRAPPVPTVPQKATSLTVPNEKSLLLPAPSQKALSSDPQPQRVFLPPTTLEKTSAGPGMLLRGDVLQISKEKRELMVGAQQVKTVELRTQAVPLGLPFSTTKEESKEGLTGRSGVKAGAREKEEQISLDLPGGKSKEMGWQKRWVKTHALTLEGPPQESTRPFSVEGLALAKLMIMASSKEQCLRPPAVALPSWLSLSSRESTVSKEASIPFELSQESWLERTPVEVREQPDSNIELKKVTGQWRDVEEAPWDPRKYPQASFHSSPASRSPRMESGPRPPIALPATRWEDVEHLPVASRSPRMDVMARMPQQPLRISKEPSQDLLATMGSSSNTLLPVLVESLRDVSPDGAAAKDKVDIFTVLPSMQDSQLFK
ncbi:Golgi-associated RAB2 interactor protein 5B isoform X2 [Tamandua tetradactyla]|uniref:Golgi-associated RAB2 interactor protein 5B isoform X2 n=1 Tax=Tamandua tetradactyla TaxID=48850 RepID=UPI0040543613